MRAQQRDRLTEKKQRSELCPSTLWPSARSAPTDEEREREREGVVSVWGCVCEGANIPLAGSPGLGGGQGSAAEGEAACPAVN